MTKQYDAVVIGGGHNGLTAAITLARSGKKVALVESSELGGLCRAETFGSDSLTLGTLADTGLLRSNALKFLDLPKSGLKFEKEPLPVFLPQQKGQGEGLLLHHDSGKAQQEISRFSAKDAESYKEYRNFIKRVRPVFEKIFDAPAPDLATMSVPGLFDILKKAVSLRFLGRKDMMEVLRIGPMCVADWVSEWFETELLRTGLCGPAVYGTWCGPWSPSTNANLMIYECMQSAPVVGGAPALVTALEDAARSSKVEILTGQKVTRILTKDGKATGVELQSGERLESKAVCSSLNPKSSILDLVENNEVDTKFEIRLQQYRMRGTTSIMHVELNEPISFDCRPELKPAHIRIADTIDDLERAFDPVKYRQFALKPALEIFQTQDAQRNGKYVAHVSVHFTPHNLEGGWTDEKKKELEHTVVDRLAEYSSGVKDKISAVKLLTPVDIESQFNLFGGHLHHGEHAPDQILVRPTLESANYRTPIAGLYLCGSGAHPGGGITCGPGFYGARSVDS